MKNSNRRYFLRNASLTATGVLLMSRTGARKSARRSSSLSCAPLTNYALTGTVSSVKSGKWSDPTVWSGNTLPGASDTPLIAGGHTITFDVVSATVAGVNVNSGGVLQFDPLTGCTLQTSQNVVVEGTLQMRPNTPTIIHTLRFINFDESKFVGGGMDVLATDVGLWVMGSGKLDIAGSSKTSWLRAGGAVAAGTTSIAMETAPSGWLEGDELVITPTGAPGTKEFSNWTSTNVKSVSGASVSISGSALGHPKVNNLYTAEVMNLTRNARIEGTPSSHAHIFIRSTVPQTIKYARMKYMGPRKDRSGDGVKELVAGRYGIHFHHCDEGSRGSQIEGVVITDCDNHTFVPHVSHGVKFLDCIAYNVTEIAFWFDPGDPTHDAIFDHNIAALVKFVPRSLDMNAEDSPTFASSGFSLNSGDGNICRNNVVVGTIGDPGTGGGFNWEAVMNDGVWQFQNNMAHNAHCGIRIWQNTTLNHTIEDFHGYHNETGIFHGAYANRYNYRNMVLYGCHLEIKAASTDTNRVRFENMTIDGGGLVDYCVQVIESPLDGAVPLFLRNLTLKGARKAAITDQSPEFYKCIDVIACTIEGNPYYMPDGISTKEVIRVQPASGTPFAIVRKDLTGLVNGITSIVGGVVGQLVSEWNGRKTEIAQFAPSLWGNGNGLKAEYYNGTNFDSLAFTRIDPNISFYEWGNQIHHLITNTSSYSVRWTGQIQPQYTEAFTFTVGAGGGYRVWINNQQIMNSWQENYPSAFKSGPINLVAGQKYDVKIEYYNGDARSGMSLMWESKSLPQEYVPQSQLYTEAISAPPPTNNAPVANAGTDITVQLPTSSTTLNGSASYDPDGTITKYLWTKMSGPTAGLIVSPISATSSLTGLVEGTYVFRLQVTDDKGVTSEDSVTVTVKPDTAPPPNKPPVVNAGADITIQLPIDYTTLKGTGSDPEGGTVSYKWTLAGGTATAFKMTNDSAAQTDVTGLTVGAYVFRLTVTDNKGATASDDVSVLVKAASTTPPPANKPPVAKAGNDISITLPTNSCILNGSGTDSDGTIASYKWTLVGGTATQYNLANPNSAVTQLSNLTQGNYYFRLTVTDSSGATAYDDVTVTVNAAPGGGGGGTNPGNPGDPPVLLKPLTVTAAPNPTSSVWKLSIVSSSELPITVRIYDSRGNLVTTIKNVSNSATLTVGAFLRRGTYVAVVDQGVQKKLVNLVKI